MSELLNNSEIAAALEMQPQWEREGDTLVRAATFPTFLTGLAAINDIATLAEEANHHPDIDIRWRTVHFRCTTHSKGGITQLDVNLAQAIEDVISKHQPS
ncbi:4a-hydroxytetrahydrobiopterin dehydratase [Hoyosella rhizosphaerae]|uniref:Putative pterin-4-alpha-carbinolamine dehydratase n=1 Tax=Hoyosella rhizosphaerae TaxID=1755582 RepID=A0A916UD64_9ACTN|nr:4a-hydroxytetrahydrobiopterin dehydratase [Hoyosella rhizosphaerae]MBN4925630.1 4a-hydroxytetrahydrobiopterin dehydratase [Hoyosella rhizosphaerae]GGC69140.1 putative pterin-4-alpha-carbinolamine dehydratase [Hoyosella rhizosphaerae]